MHSPFWALAMLEEREKIRINVRKAPGRYKFFFNLLFISFSLFF